MSVNKFALAVVCILCLTAAVAMGQATSGSMSGTVTDPTGATVPGAGISAVHQPAGRVFETRTSDAGLYVLPNLPPGPYEIAVEQPGFKNSSAPASKFASALAGAWI